MVVLITEKVPATLRGELSRWMIEPRTGVFVGQISAMVRDRLWALAVKSAKGGGVILLWSSPTEQGFQWRIHGDTHRDLLDFEGLSLVYIPPGPQKGKARKNTPSSPTNNPDPAANITAETVKNTEEEESSL